MNRFLGYSSLFAVIFWLLFSYLPLDLLAQFKIAAPVALTGFYRWLTVGGLLLFLGIQVLLIRSTTLFVRRNHHARQEQVEVPRLSLVWELWWTAVPLFMTVGLAVVGFQLWSSL